MIRNRAQKLLGKSEDSGFTLIELLVVVVIIGILVAIAIPLYLNYRKGAENKSAMSDIRNGVATAETFYSENNNVYPVAGNNSGSSGTAIVLGTTTSGTSGTGGTAETINVSSGNTLYFNPISTTGYTICASNSDGGTIYIYNSVPVSGGAPAGQVTKSASADLATCASTGK